MVKRIKTALYNKLTEAGYNVTDSGRYEEEFPWLMIRTGNIQKTVYADVICGVISLTVDVFSTDPTERELLDIEEDVTRIVTVVGGDLSFVMNSALKSARILDDNKKGPVQKHGVFNYTFLVAAGEKFEEVEVPPDEQDSN